MQCQVFAPIANSISANGINGEYIVPLSWFTGPPLSGTGSLLAQPIDVVAVIQASGEAAQVWNWMRLDVTFGCHDQGPNATGLWGLKAITITGYGGCDSRVIFDADFDQIADPDNMGPMAGTYSNKSSLPATWVTPGTITVEPFYPCPGESPNPNHFYAEKCSDPGTKLTIDTSGDVLGHGFVSILGEMYTVTSTQSDEPKTLLAATFVPGPCPPQTLMAPQMTKRSLPVQPIPEHYDVDSSSSSPKVRGCCDPVE